MPLDFDCGFCESAHFLGRSGICLNETCVCGEGFSGKDDWLSFSGCQVNDKLRTTTHLVVLTICVLTFLICLTSLIIQVRKWRFRFCPSSVHLNNQHHSTVQSHSFFYPPKLESKNDRSYRIWKRKILTLATICAFIVLSIGGALYSGSMQDGSNREDKKTAVALGYYLIVGPGFLGGYFMILVWFYSLPDISAYGNLLNMNKYLVKYPNFVPICLFVNGIIVQISLLLGVLIIPISTEDSEILLITDHFAIAALIYANVVALSIWWVTMDTMEIVFRGFIQCVAEGSKNALSQVEESELKQMVRALRPIKLAKLFCFTTVAVGWLLQILNLVTGTTQIYILTNLSLIFSLSIILMPLCFVILDDILAPKVKLEVTDSTVQA